VASISATGYSFQMVGSVPVVTAPAEIDVTTADGLRAIAFEWHSRGEATVVVDLTATRFCDWVGLQELVRAHQRAVADGGGLRLVIPAGSSLQRVFGTGLGSLVPHFATVTQALAEVPAAATRHNCAQCGAVFVPEREHARFCSRDCRAAWDGEHLGDPAVEASALTWSMAAMSEATARLPAVRVWDQEQAFAVIGEAVWWITMVDATLVRHYLGAYDAVMAVRTPAEHRLIAETLAGLRFARNWTSRGAPLGEAIETGAGTRRITQWMWKAIPEPAHAWLPPRAQTWELARYRAYQARLAGHTIGQAFGQVVPFLTLTGENAASASS